MVAIGKSKAPKTRKPHGRSQWKPLSSISIDKKGKRKRINDSNKNPNLIPLGKNKILADRNKNKEEVEEREKEEKNNESGGGEATFLISIAPVAQQLDFFLDRFQSANKIKLSPLELDAYKDSCMVKLAEGIPQDVDNLSDHIKSVFGPSWKEVLTEEKLVEDAIDAGSPALVIVSTSALRSLEILRGLKSFTKQCHPAKLFAKHMKVEDQATSLKSSRVNIASGTPSRINKLINMDALTLSRTGIILLDMYRDVKGYSLLTLPQVSTEFWDLYKSHFQQRLLQGEMKICLYGAVPINEKRKKMANPINDN